MPPKRQPEKIARRQEVLKGRLAIWKAMFAITAEAFPEQVVIQHTRRVRQALQIKKPIDWQELNPSIEL